MIVKELILALQQCDPDADVCVWLDGERSTLHPTLPLDQWGHLQVDINLAPEHTTPEAQA